MEKSLKILLVDDDDLDRKVIVLSLKKTGLLIEVEEVDNSVKALEKIFSNYFDCVFLDYRLPGKSGLEVLQEVRTKGNKTPIVILTAHGDEPLAVEIMKAGASDYIPKTLLNSDGLSLSIRNAIRTRQAEDKIELHQKELKKERDFNQAILDTISSLVVILDKQARIVSFNSTCEKNLGYKLQEVEGKLFQEFFQPSKIKENNFIFGSLFDSLIKGNFPQTCEYNLVNKTGNNCTIVWVFTCLLDNNGQVTHIVCTGTDITEIKLVELELTKAKKTAESATRAKTQFLANMSHEIRTPLTAVIGMTELLLSTNLTSEQKGYGKTIRASSDVLLTLINDILDLSKIESDKLDLEENPFNLKKCIEQTIELVSNKVNEKGLELVYNIDNDVPIMLIGDITRLRQILVNLIGNAAKFTSEGEIVLSVDKTKKIKDKYEIHFSIKDTGIGIEPEKIDKLFQAFTQVDASVTRQYGGTGLGLAISKQLCEMMGGNIWVESNFGQGTTFHFTIVVGSTTGKLSDTYNTAVLTGKKVLIIDYNQTTSDVLVKQVENWAMVPKSAATVNDVVALIQQHHFDVAIVDLYIPQITEMPVIKEIRKYKKDLPIIILAFQNQIQNISPEIRKDFTAFITKPVNSHHLYDVLDSLFSSDLSQSKEKSMASNTPKPMAEELPLRILLVEDNEVVREVVELMLRKAGYQIGLAQNGLSAIEALKSQTYDLVLMDVQMPEMDGLTATKEICRLWPKSRPRIVGMTAGAMLEDRKACLEAGMDDYVSKPLSWRELQTVLYRSQFENSFPSSAKHESKATESINDSINWQTLEQIKFLHSGDPIGWEELVEMFRSGSEKRLNMLKEASSKEQIGNVRSLAHALKGSTSNLGAVKMAEICHKIEKVSESEFKKSITPLIQNLEIEFERVYQTLKNTKVE